RICLSAMLIGQPGAAQWRELCGRPEACRKRGESRLAGIVRSERRPAPDTASLKNEEGSKEPRHTQKRIIERRAAAYSRTKYHGETKRPESGAIPKSGLGYLPSTVQLYGASSLP